MRRVFLAKYIHIFYGKDLKFIGSLIRAFNDPNSGIDPVDHLFVFTNAALYKELGEFNNVILDQSGKNLYIKYSNCCNWIISHGLEPRIRVILTPRRIRKKIVYRYWGGSETTSLCYQKWRPIYNVRLFLKRKVFESTMKSFAAIGVANIVDILDLSRVIRDGRYYYLDYAYGEYGDAKSKVLTRIIENKDSSAEKSDVFNIMVGHRGTPENNHLEIIKSLQRFNTNKLHIYVPLSYGDKAYIEKVKSEIEKLNVSNVTIITDFMDYSQYASFLYTMDIGIFDGETSYALGNIFILLFFRKKIYISEAGIIKTAFDLEKIPYGNISDISQMTFAQFTSPAIYEDEASLLLSRDINATKKNWDLFFQTFK